MKESSSGMSNADIIHEIDKLPEAGQQEVFAFLTQRILARQGADPQRWLGKRLTFEEACEVVFRENRELLGLLAK